MLVGIADVVIIGNVAFFGAAHYKPIRDLAARQELAGPIL
jgi:hypothetical protein